MNVCDSQLPSRARSVLDDNGLPQRFRELRPDDPCHEIIAAASGKTHNDPDRFAWVACRVLSGRRFAR